MNREQHNIPPVWDENSTTLILGSFPSVSSRGECFFYAHAQNRFWRVIASLYNEEIPQSIPEKQQLLLSHGIALWDVVSSCEISGSSDNSIQNAAVNDIMPLINGSRINRIFLNGAAAAKLYNKYLLPQTGISAVLLPSTSPANAVWTLDRLCEAWSVIIK